VASVKREKKPARHVVVERITKRNPAAERIARRQASKHVRRAPTGPKPEPELRPARDRGRRALSHVGGATELVGGTEAEQKALSSALSVRADEASTQAHVHGFHSYPARLHPLTARRLIEGLSEPGARVLDPFCGSGTVLVEARLLGRAALGVDVNPLAIELSELKTNGPGAPWAKRLVQVAARVAEHADERRLTKAGATMRYEKSDVELFAPNVLLELDSLKDGIGRVEDATLARALFIVLSAVLTKVSARAGDTGRLEGAKRLPAGFTARVFRQKAEELARRLGEAAALVPPGAPLARVVHGDARDLHFISDGKVDLAVSSPPYAGVYDYIVHHRDRLRWLGLPEDRFAEHEIGARRHARGASFGQALGRFERELGASLSELGRTLAPRGVAVLIIADSVLGGRAVYAEELVARLCERAGLAVGATASQKRPHVHAPTQDAFSTRPRREHAILLRRAAGQNPIRSR
jgi:DNA modification methylase